MNEQDAQAWIADRYDALAVERLQLFVAMVTEENLRQNLVAPSTIPQIWVRHVVDSAQLLDLVPAQWATWLDIGTGGGFPGLVIAAIASDREVTMAEPRRKRADFLASAIKALGLPKASVVQTKAEAVTGIFDIVSARAVASVGNILGGAAACASASTTWVLPRGVIDAATDEHLGSLRSTVFHVEHSITEPTSAILVLEGNGR